MGKTCKDCGKRLGFFSIFSSIERCDECQKKSNRTIRRKNRIICVYPTSSTTRDTQQIFCESVGGHIEYYNLQDWWLNTLTADERNTLLTLYKPLGFSPDSRVK